MSEMVERVARAIQWGDFNWKTGGLESSALEPDWEEWGELYIFMARAAIAALRVPTDGMTKAGLNAVLGPPAHPLDLPSQSLIYPVSAWEAMIDAILEEK